MKKIIGVLLSVIMCATLFTGCSSSKTTDSGSSDQQSATDEATATDTSTQTTTKFKIGVSNAYMGNDWRQLMIRCLEVAAIKDEYIDKVDLTIVNSENSAEAQVSAIDAMAEQGYDAILIDASSSAALLPSIQRAMDKGIVVVTFDSVVDEDGIYTVQTDFVSMVEAWAKYLCEKCGQGAKIAVDTGMPGSTNGNTIYEAAMKVFEENNMNVVAEFASQYADGICQEQLASVLAANPDLQGIFSQAYVESCYAALTQAGMDLIPCAAFDTNLGMMTASINDMDSIIGNNFPGIGVLALDVAVRVLEGETVEEDTFVTAGLYVTDKDKDMDIGASTTVIQEGVNCWAEQPDGLDWPVLPDDFTKISIDVNEVSNFSK